MNKFSFMSIRKNFQRSNYQKKISNYKYCKNKIINCNRIYRVNQNMKIYKSMNQKRENNIRNNYNKKFKISKNKMNLNKIIKIYWI